MPPKDQSENQESTFREQIVLTKIDGLDKTIGAQIKGLSNEIKAGFMDIRTNIDKIEREQLSSREDRTKNSVNIGINSQKLSSFKWVMAILITLSLGNLACLIKIATMN
ncbi:hypothetical protein KAR91_04100 [Candidatus Pacearchaeota archaeon]|nr:hypothetical protein [Candidatus Pacearchaeota archaeon]